MPRIEISEDQFSASLVLEAGETLDAPNFERMLAAKHIHYGLLPDVSTRVAEACGPATIEIARGDPACNARDAAIVPAFEGSRREVLVPHIGSDGRADFRNLGLAINVSPGDVLARRIPPVPARPGMTVQGRIVQPPFPRDRVLRAGPGVQISADGSAAIALFAGNPYLDGDVVCVRKVFTLDDGVNLKTGNITFDGDVRIHGTVTQDMVVNAAGSVWVTGAVEGARITAGSHVYVEGGILKKARIEAGGEVQAKFIEHSSVHSKGPLRVTLDVLHSEIEVYGALDAGGALIGGELVSYSHGRSRFVGSRAATPTLLKLPGPPAACGEAPALEAELLKTQATLSLLTPKIRKAKEELSLPSRGPAQADSLKKLLELASLMLQKEAQLKERLAALGTAQPTGAPYFEVLDTLFPGVKLTLGAANLPIHERHGSACLQEQHGIVTFTPGPVR